MIAAGTLALASPALVDFLGRKDGREVYLCWRLGEPEVAYWHELDAGYTGRRPLTPGMVREAESA